MKRYRKKPVVIEAVKNDGSDGCIDLIKQWVGDDFMFSYKDGSFKIHTKEGDMTAGVGDYIIKGIKGEFYPCKPDIFAMTYELEEPTQEE